MRDPVLKKRAAHAILRHLKSKKTPLARIQAAARGALALSPAAFAKKFPEFVAKKKKPADG